MSYGHDSRANASSKATVKTDVRTDTTDRITFLVNAG